MKTTDEFRQHAITLISDYSTPGDTPQTIAETSEGIVDLFIPMLETRIAAADDIIDKMDAGLRKFHVPETFNDCVEDGQHFPCQTIKLLNIVARHRGLSEDEVAAATGFAEGQSVKVGERVGKLVLEVEPEGPEAPASWFVEFEPDGNVERIMTDNLVAAE
jgi:hypothetical protein